MFYPTKKLEDKYHYIFSGIIHPERVLFGLNSKLSFHIEQKVFCIKGNGVLEFQDSHFVVEYISAIDHTKEENANFETLRNYVDEVIMNVVDLYCFIKSYNYDVEIIGMRCKELNIDHTFDVQGEKNINKDQEQTNKELTNLLLFFSMRSDLVFLHDALADFRRSIRYPKMTGFFCFRAIETIRRFYFEDMTVPDDTKRRNLGWKTLRDSLSLDRDFFKDIEKFALPNRHGEYPTITYPERKKIMNKTREVINKFIAHVSSKEVDGMRLPDGRREGKIQRIL